MANSEAGRLLTEAYRDRQLAVRAAAIRDLLAVWPAFQLDDIDRSWGPVEAALLAIIARRRHASAGLAANYFRAYRTAEGAAGDAQPRLAADTDRTLVLATLRLLGPIGTKKNISAGLPNPLDRAFSRVSGSVARQVLNGGRQTLLESARADRAAKGFRRVASAKACPFCRRLASYGIVGLNADFEAHDHCSCTQEVAY